MYKEITNKDVHDMLKPFQISYQRGKRMTVKPDNCTVCSTTRKVHVVDLLNHGTMAVLICPTCNDLQDDIISDWRNELKKRGLRDDHMMKKLNRYMKRTRLSTMEKIIGKE